MEIRTEKKLIERVVDTYIAVDGKEFDNKKACMDYEFELEVGKIMEEVKKFQFIDDGYVPCDGQENMESHFYEWYKVENAEQLEQLQNLYDGVPCVENFPEYICCERYDETDYDVYAQTLTGCKEYVKLFFDKFGIDVEFKTR